MQRCLEPELMNAAEQVLAYAAADFSAGDAATIRQIKALIGRSPALPQDPLVVDLGCGPGNITLLLAEALPQAKVIGIDGAERMLELARQRAKDQGLAIRFLQQDLRQVSGLKADLIVSNSLLHHLHDPAMLWSATRRLAAPCCRVLHRDLRRPDSLVELNQLEQRHLDAAPQILKRDFRASLAAAFELTEVRAQLQQAQLNGLDVVEEDDRYLVVSGLVD